MKITNPLNRALTSIKGRFQKRASDQNNLNVFDNKKVVESQNSTNPIKNLATKPFTLVSQKIKSRRARKEESKHSLSKGSENKEISFDDKVALFIEDFYNDASHQAIFNKACSLIKESPSDLYLSKVLPYLDTLLKADAFLDIQVLNHSIEETSCLSAESLGNILHYLAQNNVDSSHLNQDILLTLNKRGLINSIQNGSNISEIKTNLNSLINLQGNLDIEAVQKAISANKTIREMELMPLVKASKKLLEGIENPEIKKVLSSVISRYASRLLSKNYEFGLSSIKSAYFESAGRYLDTKRFDSEILKDIANTFNVSHSTDGKAITYKTYQCIQACNDTQKYLYEIKHFDKFGFSTDDAKINLYEAMNVIKSQLPHVEEMAFSDFIVGDQLDKSSIAAEAILKDIDDTFKEVQVVLKISDQDLEKILLEHKNIAAKQDYIQSIEGKISKIVSKNKVLTKLLIEAHDVENLNEFFRRKITSFFGPTYNPFLSISKELTIGQNPGSVKFSFSSDRKNIKLTVYGNDGMSETRLIKIPVLNQNEEALKNKIKALKELEGNEGELEENDLDLFKGISVQMIKDSRAHMIKAKIDRIKLEIGMLYLAEERGIETEIDHSIEALKNTLKNYGVDLTEKALRKYIKENYEEIEKFLNIKIGSK